MLINPSPAAFDPLIWNKKINDFAFLLIASYLDLVTCEMNGVSEQE